MYTAPYTDTECRLAAGLSHAKEIHTTTFDSLGVDLAAVPAAPLRKPILAVLHLPLETQPATWRNFQGLSRLRRIRILPPPRPLLIISPPPVYPQATGCRGCGVVLLEIRAAARVGLHGWHKDEGEGREKQRARCERSVEC